MDRNSSIFQEIAQMTQTMIEQPPVESITKTVSLRMDHFDLARLDLLAEKLDLSRQSILETIVLNGLADAIAAHIETISAGDENQMRERCAKFADEVLERGNVYSIEAGGGETTWTGMEGFMAWPREAAIPGWVFRGQEGK